MNDYHGVRKQIVSFLNESGIDPYDLARISKDLCRCGTCMFYVPHYLKDGTATDFGHCQKNKIPKATRTNSPSCGFWSEGDSND